MALFSPIYERLFGEGRGVPRPRHPQGVRRRHRGQVPGALRRALGMRLLLPLRGEALVPPEAPRGGGQQGSVGEARLWTGPVPRVLRRCGAEENLPVPVVEYSGKSICAAH